MLPNYALLLNIYQNRHILCFNVQYVIFKLIFGLIMSQENIEKLSDASVLVVEDIMNTMESKLLVKDLLGLVASYLPPNESTFQHLVGGAPRFFPDWVGINELILAVEQGVPATVLAIVSKNPDILFKKEPFAALSKPSAFQLMLFSLDWDMLNQMRPFIFASQKSCEKAYEQIRAMQGGGPDLVTMSRDPMTLTFRDLMCYGNYPLLENTNGIIFCSTTRQFFYADQETQSLVPIKLDIADSDQNLFDEFVISLSAEEDNSSRRSTNEEHALILRTMKCDLERRGISYTRMGVEYKDTQFPAASIVNAYRKYIRLYNDGAVPWDEVESAWLDKGKTLCQEVHLLQRICEENAPFSPLPSRDILMNRPFNRTLQYTNLLENRRENLQPFNPEAGLGIDFSLSKGNRNFGAVGGKADGRDMMRWERDGVDLAAILQIVNVGKESVANLMEELNQNLMASSDCSSAAP